MERNAKPLKFIIALNSTHFWGAIWLLYYLRFTDYAGVGLLFGIMVPLGLVLEIPTGALADLIGKRKTLILAFLLNAIASLSIGLSTNFNQLLIAVFFSVTAGALYSGTTEALLYDSLKKVDRESEFENKFASIQKISLIVASISTIVGGIMYSNNVLFPWIARSICLFIAGFLSFLLIEPQAKDESSIFNLKNFISQNKQGFAQIFNKVAKPLIFELLIVLSFIYIITEEIESAFVIEIGYDPVRMGILFGVIPLISAIGFHFYKDLKKKFGLRKIFGIGSIFIFISTLISPWLSLITGTLLLAMRHFAISLIKVSSSASINENLDSKYRTTALSTFNLLVTLPYSISPIIIGQLVERNSASNTLFFISTIFVTIYVILKFVYSSQKSEFKKIV